MVDWNAGAGGNGGCKNPFDDEFPESSGLFGVENAVEEVQERNGVNGQRGLRKRTSMRG